MFTPKKILYTTKDMARALNCSPQRVTALVRQNKIKALMPTYLLCKDEQFHSSPYRFTWDEVHRVSKLYRLSWIKSMLYTLAHKLIKHDSH